MATKRRKDIIEIMAPKEIPLPGYTTAKPLMAPIKLMLSELGAQDACIQLQELSIEYLRNSATATKAPIGDFLKLLYKGNKIPQGTHDFSELRELASKSYLVVTYALLEKMLRSVIVEYKRPMQLIQILGKQRIRQERICHHS